MRILHLLASRDRRGAEIFAHELATQQERDGHTTALCYLTNGIGRSLPLRPQDVVMNSASPNSISPTSHLRLARLISTWAPDVVQANGSITVKQLGVVALACPWRNWIAVRRLIGDPRAWASGYASRSFYSILNRYAFDAVVSVSRAGLENLGAGPRITAVAEGGIPTQTLLEQGGGKRAEIRRATGIAEDEVLALYVGALSQEKQIDHILRAISILSDRNLHLMIVGDGPCLRSLRALAGELRLRPNRIHFLGSAECVSAYYEASDVLILSSKTEGIPRVILEAGAFSKPTIAYAVGGIPEIITHGKTGLLVTPNSIQELASSLNLLAWDHVLRTALGEGMSAVVFAKHDISHSAQRFEAIYHAASQARRRQADHDTASILRPQGGSKT